MKIAFNPVTEHHIDPNMPSGELRILADDGFPLYWLTLAANGSLIIDTIMPVKYAGVMLADQLVVKPQSACQVIVKREPLETRPRPS